MRKSFQTLEVQKKDNIQPIIDAFKEYCTGKANITVVRYQFNSFKQTIENTEAYIRELQQLFTATTVTWKKTCYVIDQFAGSKVTIYVINYYKPPICHYSNA